MNCSEYRILIPFFTSVALSKIAHLLFTTTFTSHYSISIALHCASAIVYTYVACYTFNYIFVNNCSSWATTFSSLASFCIVYASIKWCSSSLSSSNSSMHIESIDVVSGFGYFLAHQHRLLLFKNSIAYVPIIFVFWIIAYVNTTTKGVPVCQVISLDFEWFHWL
jgi:hypothetical protein